MEKEGLHRTIQLLSQQNVNVSAFGADRHCQIKMAQ